MLELVEQCGYGIGVPCAIVNDNKDYIICSKPYEIAIDRITNHICIDVHEAGDRRKVKSVWIKDILLANNGEHLPWKTSTPVKSEGNYLIFTKEGDYSFASFVCNGLYSHWSIEEEEEKRTIDRNTVVAYVKLIPPLKYILK